MSFTKEEQVEIDVYKAERAAQRKLYKERAIAKNRLSPKSEKRPEPDNPEYVKAMRMCLGPDCGKQFKSEWKGNRLCVSCTTKVRNKSAFEPDFGSSGHQKQSSGHHK